MSERPLQLMLVDEDPTFRLGLRVWLEQLPGFQIAAEAASATEALATIRKCDRTQADAFTDPTLRGQRPIDLVIIDLGLGVSTPGSDPVGSSGLQLCKSIKTDFPKLSVLVLSASAEPVLEAAARQVGADGYGTRGMPVRELAQLIRAVARVPDKPAQRPSALPPIPTPMTAMRLSMRLSGLAQIDRQMAKTAAQLRQPRLSWLKQQILAGQLRELRAARWCVKQLRSTRQYSDAGWTQKNIRPRTSYPKPTPVPRSVGAAAAIKVPKPAALSLQSRYVQTLVFDAFLA